MTIVQLPKLRMYKSIKFDFGIDHSFLDSFDPN